MISNILKSLVLVVSITIDIECQVLLNRDQLAAWYPSYSTAVTIDVHDRSISLIDVGTFSGLSKLGSLDLR
jgi:hypothetical protein